MNAPKKYFSKDFFAYEQDFLALVAGGTASGNITIQADSDFRLEKTVYFADIAAAGQTFATQVVPLVTVLITDASSGRQLSNSPLAIPALFGVARDPFIWETPHIFAARSTITIAVANFDAANTYNLRLSFLGTKLYY